MRLSVVNWTGPAHIRCRPAPAATDRVQPPILPDFLPPATSRSNWYHKALHIVLPQLMLANTQLALKDVQISEIKRDLESAKQAVDRSEEKYRDLKLEINTVKQQLATANQILALKDDLLSVLVTDSITDQNNSVKPKKNRNIDALLSRAPPVRNTLIQTEKSRSWRANDNIEIEQFTLWQITQRNIMYD